MRANERGASRRREPTRLQKPARVLERPVAAAIAVPDLAATPCLEARVRTCQAVVDEPRHRWMGESRNMIAPRRPSHLFGAIARARHEEHNGLVSGQIDRTTIVDAQETIRE